MSISPIDTLIILGYFAAVITIGLVARRRNRSSEDFVNAGRDMPWGAVLGSIVATEVSAATFLAVPGVGYGENMNYLQFGIGSIAARVFVATAFLGAFYATRSLTVYAYLGTRFGPRTRTTATVFFIVTRLLASAVRLMIATAGIHLILGVPFEACLAVFTLVAVVYTGNGGIRGVIWTDVLQATVFLASGICVLAYVVNAVGLEQILETGREFGRFEVFRFRPEEGGSAAWFADPKLLWVAVAFGFLGTAASFGTDQDTTQRMLTCRDVGRARLSVILSGVIAIPIAALFLTVGIALFTYYRLDPAVALPAGSAADDVFPLFIRNELPPGINGLLLTGLLAAAMSSLDSTMSALSSSTIVDLYRPLRKRLASDRSYLLLTRLFVLVFGILLALIAWLLKDAAGYLWLAFQIGSITYGGLLGIFTLGTLTRRGSDRGNVVAMASGALLCAVLLWAIRTERLALGWTWLILIGTAWTFILGWLMDAGDRKVENER